MEPYDYHMAPSNKDWLAIPENLMFVHGEDIGLATFDYPGLYSVHWFYKNAKGKEAKRLAIAMLDEVFTKYGAKVVRGVIHMDNKPARFLAKHIGYERISIEDFADGPNEVIILTKENFIRCKEQINGT